MKEATGELSGTVITVVAIAAVAAIFTLLILPIIKTNIALTTACSNADTSYYKTDVDKGYIECQDGVCTFHDNETNKSSSKTCSGATNNGGAADGGGAAD